MFPGFALLLRELSACFILFLAHAVFYLAFLSGIYQHVLARLLTKPSFLLDHDPESGAFRKPH